MRKIYLVIFLSICCFKFVQSQSPSFTASCDTNGCNICLYSCVNFHNTSCCWNSYKWFVTGGYPGSDTSTNPNDICYVDSSGSFDVTLIGIGGIGNDTIIYHNYINVFS